METPFCLSSFIVYKRVWEKGEKLSTGGWKTKVCYLSAPILNYIPLRRRRIIVLVGGVIVFDCPFRGCWSHYYRLIICFLRFEEGDDEQHYRGTKCILLGVCKMLLLLNQSRGLALSSNVPCLCLSLHFNRYSSHLACVVQKATEINIVIVSFSYVLLLRKWIAKRYLL